MEEIMKTLTAAFVAHWGKVAVGATMMGIGWLIGWWRARKRWEKKEFFERINFSLNSIHQGKLKIRTLMEKKCADVFLNQVAVSKVLECALKTSTENAIIPLPEKDYWFYLNAALNEVSEKFAAGFIRRDAGQDQVTSRYVLCLTNECDGAIRTRKVRAMLILESDLKDLPEEMPELESKNHVTRWKTLQHMAEAIKDKPYQFFKVELVV